MYRDPSDDAGASGGAPQRPAFQFDLGGALARLTDPDAADVAPTPAPTPAQPAPDPRRAPAPARDHTPSDGLVRPYARPRSSVFADAPPAPQPTPQPTPQSAPSQPAPAPAPQPSLQRTPQPSLQPEPSVATTTAPAPAPAPAPSPAPLTRTTIAPSPSVFDTPGTAAAPAQPQPSLPSAPSVPMRGPGATAPITSPSLASSAPPVFSSPVVTQPVAANDAGGVLLAEPPTLTDPTIGAAPYLPPPTPASVAVPTPATVQESSAASLADVKAFKAAQMRAARQRKGRMFGRTLLALITLGALVGAALYFGRSYLFPAEWDPELVPIVDELEAARGAELDRTVPLIAQPAAEYAATLVDALGEGWQERLPQWRALGLAGPDVTVEDVGAALAARWPAYYDADRDTIYRSIDVDVSALTAELRLALRSAFAEQADEGVVVETPALGFTGVSSLQRLAARAVDSHLAGRAGLAVAGAELPVPIAYEVAAVDMLGSSILESVGADPATVGFGTYPGGIYGALSDQPALASTAPLQPGETALADPVALGVDDWSLVWATQLREPTVEQLAGLVVADAYRPVLRGELTCAIGTFQTETESGADTVLGALQNWTVLAPAEAQASASKVGPTQVQLVTCDPGAAAVAPDLAIVDALVARQAARLASIAP